MLQFWSLNFFVDFIFVSLSILLCIIYLFIYLIAYICVICNCTRNELSLFKRSFNFRSFWAVYSPQIYILFHFYAPLVNRDVCVRWWLSELRADAFWADSAWRFSTDQDVLIDVTDPEQAHHLCYRFCLSVHTEEGLLTRFMSSSSVPRPSGPSVGLFTRRVTTITITEIVQSCSPHCLHTFYDCSPSPLPFFSSPSFTLTQLWLRL